MDPNAANFLWQAGDLLPKGGRWLATADRSLGNALGVLAPLRQDADGGWHVAARPEVVFMLTEVVVDAWRELRFASGGEEAQRYVCLLRYDHPEDRPGSTFNDAVAPGLLAAAPHLAPLRTGLPNAATVDEVEAALQGLWRQHGRAFERRYVSGPRPEAQPQARTIDVPAQDLRFVFASCQYPAGLMDRLDANRSYAMLAQHFDEGAPLPERILLLGDQVYTDATYGLLDPAQMDDRFRLPYEQLLGPDGPFAQLPQDLRALMRMSPDDHEIVDNWEPWGPGATGERYRRGLAAYWRYQRGEDTPPDHVWTTEPEAGAPQRGWQMFMADSRTTRDYRNEYTVEKATLLGEAQTDALEHWLQAARADLKIVTTAAMLLPRLRTGLDEPLSLDNWQGYPASFRRLLAFVCDQGIENLVFLSGDAHLGCSAQVTVSNRRTGRQAAFGSHHAPALYAPYPFANETLWNLRLQDTFDFQWTTGEQTDTYDCTVSASVLGDQRTGWGLLEARRDATGWKVEVRFLGNQEIRTPCSAAM
jgi:hypothetical protein